MFAFAFVAATRKYNSLLVFPEDGTPYKLSYLHSPPKSVVVERETELLGNKNQKYFVSFT